MYANDHFTANIHSIGKKMKHMPFVYKRDHLNANMVQKEKRNTNAICAKPGSVCAQMDGHTAGKNRVHSKSIGLVSRS